MKCSQCSINAYDTPLYRTVPLGTACKEWKCKICLNLLPEEVNEIAEIIANSNKGA